MVQFLPQAQIRAPRNVGLDQRTLADLGQAAQHFGLARQEAAAQENRQQSLADFAKTGDANALIASGDSELAAIGLRARESQANRAAAASRRSEAQAFEREKFDFLKQRFGQEMAFKLKELEAKNNQLSNKLTEGQKATDREFAKDFVTFNAGGGFADIEKQLSQLETVAKQLKEGKNLTGPLIGITPDSALSFVNPEAVDARESVEEVAQRNLRQILGGQFAQKEGEQLIRRAFNPSLRPEQNARRLRALISQMRTAAQQKKAASKYFEENGTLVGFEGNLPSFNSFTIEDDEPEESGFQKTKRNVRFRFVN